MYSFHLTLFWLILTHVASLEGRVFRFWSVGVSLVTFRGKTKRLGKTLLSVLYTWEENSAGTMQYKSILEIILIQHVFLSLGPKRD